MDRKIIHLDMDAFYAAVEQRDFPELRGKPVIVGGSPDSRGVVCTASYEARKFGVSSAMPCSRARRLCPDGIFIAPRFSVYSEISRQIMAIFREFTDQVEPLSLDEAFLDVTANKLDFRLGREAALELKRRILAATGLTATAGVAPNKFLAKVASGMNKPDGLTVVAPTRIGDFLRDMPVRRLPGVGRVTEQRMQHAGIFLVTDLQTRSSAELTGLFGKQGSWFLALSYGLDDRPVRADRIRRSVGCEDTFVADLLIFEQAEFELEKIAAKLGDRLERKSERGRTLTLKVTYSDFVKITRSQSFDQFVTGGDQIFRAALELARKTEIGSRPFRLLGLTISNLAGEAVEEPADTRQLSLWADYGPVVAANPAFA